MLSIFNERESVITEYGQLVWLSNVKVLLIPCKLDDDGLHVNW